MTLRPRLVAGNWKMNTNLEEALGLTDDLVHRLGRRPAVECVICPPHVHLAKVAERLQGSGIRLGAQNLFWEDSGAYTGEISGAMLRGLCEYVIVGHSERRALFGETDETARRRVAAALRNGLRPILCVGETLDEREAGVAPDVVSRQVRRAIEDLTSDGLPRVTIAYEPVWAIGTGRAATPESAREMARDVIRPALASLHPSAKVDAVRVLYGGSVTGANAHDFFGVAELDGGLVGGASLRAEEFAAIVAAAA